MSNGSNKNKKPTYFVQQPDYTVVIQGNNQKEYRFLINVEPETTEPELIVDKENDMDGKGERNNINEEKSKETSTELKRKPNNEHSGKMPDRNDDVFVEDEFAKEKELLPTTQDYEPLQMMSVDVDEIVSNEEIVNEVNDTETTVPIENTIQTKAEETEHLQLTAENNEKSTVTHDTTKGNNDIYNEESQAEEEEKEHRRKIRQLVKRLAFYPSVLDRPICEAKINGEEVHVQIISKRGNKVKIKKGRRLESIHINEIDELTILSRKL